MLVEHYLPRVSPGLALVLADPFELRSITINPLVLDRDGTDRTSANIAALLRMIVNRSITPNKTITIWLELQVTTSSEQPIEIPNIDILVSNALECSNSMKRTWFIPELAKALSIIRSTVNHNSPVELESAYGRGAAFIDYQQPEISIPGQNRFLAIKRPLYLSPPPSPDLHICYFTIAACQVISEGQYGHRLVFSLMPIIRETKCPVRSPLLIRKGESVAAWIPLKYPETLAAITGDDRRYISLSFGWKQSASAGRPELLSFPRVSTVYKLSASNPVFITSPTLPNDPVIWRSVGHQAFALQSESIKSRDLSDYAEAGLFLEFEDTAGREQRQLHQIWLSILSGVIISALTGAFVSILATGQAADQNKLYWIGVLVFISLVATLRLLVPR